MTRFRGRCPIRLYLQSKPDKYGIKVSILTDSKTLFACVMEAYTGKSTVSNKPEDIAIRLCSHLSLEHFFVGDNYLPL